MNAMPATSLAAYQRDFAAALLGAEPARDGTHPAAAPGPLDALIEQPGFAVYRNTVATACIDALAGNYPTVQQIVGDEWFRDAAAIFHRAHPPRDGRLALYAETFPAFLASFDPARELSYLPAVARFDRLWSEAHVAADAPVLDLADLASLTPEALAAAKLAPHPSARWAWSAAAPAFEIWRRHREGADLGAELDWRGDGGLVVRPADSVAWLELDAAAIAFLDGCAQGLAFGAAAEPIGDRIATVLPALVASGAFMPFTKAAQ